MTPTALVVGASIAGISSAYWLHRAGYSVTVVERAPALRDGGYKVDVRGAALEVISRMGLLDEVRALRTDVRSGTVVDATGRRVASMDGDTFGGRTHGDAELLRGDLTRLLHRHTADDVEYRFGEALTALPEGYDLIVGADGLHSATRALAFGPEADYVHDLGYRIAIATVPNHLGLDREEVTYVGPGRTTLVYSTAGDATAKAMFLYEGDERDLRAAYADQGWEVPRLLDGVDRADDVYSDALCQVKMDGWHRGPVVLVGDAAWCASPASGQGTSLALVGAYVLGAELAAGHGPEAYERRMRPFVERNQALGPANIKRMVLHSPGQVRTSMRMLAVMDRLPFKEWMLGKVMQPLHRAANAIELPAR
ncbi:FAD-dependent monooxygenase [Cryptosporangium arvum]|uniref:2-polyprenyl-6-methoxyphenol hydroxylase-like oxidoreductase n=1 Tax=Cryptosporangium arvum DSM 44712 TaxID=927661 RepID=A0A010ZXH6_9ACTN|nr:FAD-dependent monooxygenase [Cryptosporangium arvum]EXG81927.1 2-polyprenyl-6-methoxyphenol hydroxylase-like oxidoreductase [Cryptosporangium arvum DSM 44712]